MDHLESFDAHVSRLLDSVPDSLPVPAASHHGDPAATVVIRARRTLPHSVPVSLARPQMGVPTLEPTSSMYPTVLSRGPSLPVVPPADEPLPQPMRRTEPGARPARRIERPAAPQQPAPSPAQFTSRLEALGELLNKQLTPARVSPPEREEDLAARIADLSQSKAALECDLNGWGAEEQVSFTVSDERARLQAEISALRGSESELSTGRPLNWDLQQRHAKAMQALGFVSSPVAAAEQADEAAMPFYLDTSWLSAFEDADRNLPQPADRHSPLSAFVDDVADPPAGYTPVPYSPVFKTGTRRSTLVAQRAVKKEVVPAAAIPTRTRYNKPHVVQQKASPKVQQPITRFMAAPDPPVATPPSLAKRQTTLADFTSASPDAASIDVLLSPLSPHSTDVMCGREVAAEGVVLRKRGRSKSGFVRRLFSVDGDVLEWRRGPQKPVLGTFPLLRAKVMAGEDDAVKIVSADGERVLELWGEWRRLLRQS